MRIQAVNNTNFNGLFRDKSRENGGNWRMEYSPYSWEYSNTGRMENKRHIDIMSSKLPDNEEIFERKSNGYESSRDILGTESYYKHSDGTMRKNITQVPAMNREDSLMVQNDKLNKFLMMKKHEMERLHTSALNSPNELSASRLNYDKYSSDVKKGYFSRTYSLESSYREMDKEFGRTQTLAKEAVDSFRKYVSLRDSAEDVESKINKNKSELALIDEAKKAGKLVDISKRDIYDPNKALWEAVSTDIKSASEKLLVLPHKTISIANLLRLVNPKEVFKASPQQIIGFVDNMIRNAL